MKTKLLPLVCSTFLLVLTSNIYAQLLDPDYASHYVQTTLETDYAQQLSLSHNNDLGEIPEALDPFNFIEANNPKTIEEMSSLETHDPATAMAFVQNMLAFGAGFGFNSDQTLWCLHASYFMQLAMFSKSALYGSLGFVYSGISTDFYTASFIDFQLKLLMFTALAQNNLVHFMYGAMLGYGLGADKFKSGGGTTDITRLTAALVLGLNIYLTTRWMLMIQTNALAYQSQTNKPESGGEFKDDFTWGAFNKNNAIIISLIYKFNRVRLE
ncbi:hypothetical protein ABI125_00940 [Tamlana crocina]